MNTLYDKDFYSWVLSQTQVIKDKNYQKLDLENLIEEVECLGDRKADQLEKYLERLFICLLQWHFAPKLRKEKGSLWNYAFKSLQQEAQKLIAVNPSLLGNLDKIALAAYHRAPWHAGVETGVDEGVFPKINPWAAGDLLLDQSIEDYQL